MAKNLKYLVGFEFLCSFCFPKNSEFIFAILFSVCTKVGFIISCINFFSEIILIKLFLMFEVLYKILKSNEFL